MTVLHCYFAKPFSVIRGIQTLNGYIFNGGPQYYQSPQVSTQISLLVISQTRHFLLPSNLSTWRDRASNHATSGPLKMAEKWPTNRKKDLTHL